MTRFIETVEYCGEEKWIIDEFILVLKMKRIITKSSPYYMMEYSKSNNSKYKKKTLTISIVKKKKKEPEA